MIAQQEFTLTVAELSKRVGLNLEDQSVILALKDNYRRHSKAQIAPGARVTLQEQEGAKAVLAQISRFENPIANIIEFALTKPEASETAVRKLLWIKQLPGSRLG